MKPRLSVLIALVIGLGGLVTAPAVLAGAESDIPGVPLSPSTVTGQLGGPIYDVVYRIDVPAGHVLRASLTGDPGTDFDLYLFDSTATTVLSKQGLVAKSTGPTSVEQIAFPSYAAATFYLDLNGATDVQGTYGLTVQLVADQSKPVASLLLADGQPTTASTTVSVRLTAYSPFTGVSQMAFSGDGTAFGEWQTYTVHTSWTFPPGDGVKTLWAKVRSGTGVESAVVSSTVTLDTTPPLATAIDPTPNSTVSGLRPTFVVRFNEPMEPTSWTQLGLIVADAGGRIVTGAYAFDGASRTGTFVPDSNLVPGQPYDVTLGSARDVAGNLVASFGTWTITTLIPTALSLAASAAVVTPGTAVGLTGQADVPDGSTVHLETRLGGSDEPSAQAGLMPENGMVRMSVTPGMNSHYRLVFAGSPIAAASGSREVTVLVRRLVGLVGVSASSTRAVAPGRRVTLTAQVLPAGSGARLSFKLYRYDAGRRSYVYAGSWGRTTGIDGRASLAWTTRSGRYYWRVAVLSSPEYANNISPVYRWTVAGG